MAEKISGAQALMRALIHEDVDTIFGYPGGAIMPVYDALPEFEDQIKHVLVRHEQGASHAAEGYARVTGKPGVCFATSGPGATNLVTGIADAMMDSIPMVCITGQVFSSLLGTDAFQETDVIGVTIPITKWNYQVTKAEEIPYIISKAFYVAAHGRPGPVVIDITKDAQVDMIDLPEFCSYEPQEKTYAERYSDLSFLEHAAELINNAKQPLILAGHGVLISDARQELLDLAEKAKIPTACTLHGLSAFPNRHPLYAGMLGMHGNYAPNMLTNKADVIIAIGMRFDDRVTGDLKRYAKNAKIVHIEVDHAEVHKNVIAAAPIIADAKHALTKLLPLIREAEHEDWLTEFRDLEQEETDRVIATDIKPENGLLRMAEVIHELSEMTDGEAIVVADVGQHQMMAARYYKCEYPQSYITSGGLGTMGFAVPAAIGAKIGAPEREVIAICGDGGFQMTLQELGTIAQEKLPVKVMIMNNNYLGMVRQWQELFFDKRYSSVHLDNPDFVAISQGFRIPASRVDNRENLFESLRTMLETPGPYVLEVIVGKEDNVFPMIPSGAAVDEIRLE